MSDKPEKEGEELPLTHKPMTRDEINIAIHELMGWRRVKADPSHYQTTEGYAWKSPAGALYEGGNHMVEDYVGKLEEASEIIQAIIKAMGIKPDDGTCGHGVS